MIFYDAPVIPDDLTTFVRNVPINPNLNLLNTFPVRFLDSNTIDWAEVVRTNRTAKFRSFDGRINVSQRDGGSDKRVSLLPLSDSLSQGEYETLQLLFAQTGGTNAAALERAIYNDAENLTRNIQNRLELAWGDVLTDGILTINENDFQGVADFGVPGGNKVTAGTLWTNIAAPALADLRTWHDAYRAANGGAPGQTRMSQRVLRLLQSNTGIVNAVHGSAVGKTWVNRAELNALFESEGFAPINVPDVAQVDVDGSLVSVVPDDRLFLLPENLSDLGYTAFGISATALELVGSTEADLTFEEASGIVGVVLKDGPPFRQNTFVDCVAMPVLVDGRRLFVADVA